MRQPACRISIGHRMSRHAALQSQRLKADAPEGGVPDQRKCLLLGVRQELQRCSGKCTPAQP